MKKAIQGSKKKARKAAFIERQSRRESQKHAWQLANKMNPDASIEDMAKAYGIKLQ